jgi:D,D-heptose 1,7-bisphosphate phosphatase
VFLDKDGTLLDDVPYNVDPGLMQFMPGAAKGVRLLYAAGYSIVVVSNQSGVARGYFDLRALETVRERLVEMLADVGVPLLGFYYCPHHPEGRVPKFSLACSCRKPEPGLFFRAAAEHHIDLSNSWLIGDILDDVEAGHRAGCRSILLFNGHETEWVLTRKRMPEMIAGDLTEAASYVISNTFQGATAASL